jgi:acyl carrier protein
VDLPSEEDRIERFTRTQFSIDPTDPGFARDADLFERGYVDSVGVAELLEFLSEEFGVEIPEADLLSDEFSTIDGIAGIVRRLVRGVA